MWTYFVPNARPTDDPKYQVEAGVELVLFNGSVRSLVLDEEFFSAVSHSALLAGLAHSCVKLDKA